MRPEVQWKYFPAPKFVLLCCLWWSHHVIVGISSINRTMERASSARSAFFALNSVGTWFGLLHPSTSIKLYKTYCIPIMLFSSELWKLTKTELQILERTHNKILRSIQCLPLRCPTLALNHLMGTLTIEAQIEARQLCFIFSIINLPPASIPKIILSNRLANPSDNSIVAHWSSLMEKHALPPINTLLDTVPCSKITWKKTIKAILATKQLITFQDTGIPLTRTPSKAFTDLKPAGLWMTTRGDRLTTSKTNFRIRLTVNCHGLETDAVRFRIRNHALHNPGARCRLCEKEEEPPKHFIESCQALQQTRSRLIENS